MESLPVRSRRNWRRRKINTKDVYLQMKEALMGDYGSMTGKAVLMMLEISEIGEITTRGRFERKCWAWY